MFNPIFQLAPRFFGFLLFLALTWFVARLTKSIFTRSLAELKREEKSRLISRIAFWSVFVMMSPFLLSVVGANLTWLYTAQMFIASLMKSWPTWFLLSFLVGCILLVVRETPKAITSFRTLLESNKS